MRAPIGVKSCKLSCSTGSSIRGQSGGCTGIGLSRRPSADLLGGDFALAEFHRLYECHDKLLAHKEALFAQLTVRWRDLFDAKFEVLLYDVTSTYFESDPPADPTDPRRFGYSRDKRSDCVQVVIALIVTPAGFPLAYEMMPGNTTDKTTLKDFLAYCLQVTLKARLRRTASGLTARTVLEKFAALQMIDVHLPTTDGRAIVMARHTHPEKDLQLLLEQLKLQIPEQAPPKIRTQQSALLPAGCRPQL